MEKFKERTPEQDVVEGAEESEETDENLELAQTDISTNFPPDRAIDLTEGRNQDPFSSTKETHTRLFGSDGE